MMTLMVHYKTLSSITLNVTLFPNQLHYTWFTLIVVVALRWFLQVFQHDLECDVHSGKYVPVQRAQCSLQRVWASAGGFHEHRMSPVMAALLCLPVAERSSPLLALENFFHLGIGTHCERIAHS